MNQSSTPDSARRPATNRLTNRLPDLGRLPVVGRHLRRLSYQLVAQRINEAETALPSLCSALAALVASYDIVCRRRGHGRGLRRLHFALRKDGKPSPRHALVRVTCISSLLLRLPARVSRGLRGHFFGRLLADPLIQSVQLRLERPARLPRRAKRGRLWSGFLVSGRVRGSSFLGVRAIGF